MIYRLAGVVGVDPGPFTWRELAWMAEGRERVEWRQTALLAAVTNNTQAARPGDVRQPSDYDPFAMIDAERARPKLITSPAALAAMLGVSK